MPVPVPVPVPPAVAVLLCKCKTVTAVSHNSGLYGVRKFRFRVAPGPAPSSAIRAWAMAKHRRHPCTAYLVLALRFTFSKVFLGLALEPPFRYSRVRRIRIACTVIAPVKILSKERCSNASITVAC